VSEQQPRDLRDLLVAMSTRLECHLQECRLRFEMLDKHDRALYGNGRQGLISRVNLLMWVLGVLSACGVGLTIRVLGGG